MKWLWFTWIFSLPIFGVGMFLSLKYGENATVWQKIKSWVFVIVGEVLFWGSIIVAVITGFIRSLR